MHKALIENMKILSDVRLHTKPKIKKTIFTGMSESYHEEELVHPLILDDS